MIRWIGPGDDAEWEALFLDFARSAYRQEGLQRYASDVEDAAVVRFVAGDPHGIDLSWTTSKLAEQTATGRTQSKVRIVIEPPTDYTRMSLEIFREYATWGENVRILAVPAGTWPEPLPRHDFWMFDDARVWRMHYTADLHWRGAELIDDAAGIADHLRWRDIAMERSVPLEDYLASRTH